MSDDLISRKELIENLNKFAPEHYTALVNELIMKQPAAFDKEKVLQELKGRVDLSLHGPVISGKYIKKENAINIVEKGGLYE